MKTQDDAAQGLPDFHPESPAHHAYINAFHTHGYELVKIYSRQPEILLQWDDLMNEFNTNELMTGKVSQQSNDRMIAILDTIRPFASAPLKSAIDKHKTEIRFFPDTMAFMLFSFYFF